MSSRVLLVTGGAGFIGSNFVLEAIARGHTVINLDALTYAGNMDNLASLAGQHDAHLRPRLHPGWHRSSPSSCRKHRPDAIVHFAAESHVDRSILGPAAFVETNVNRNLHAPAGCAQLTGAASTPEARKSFRFLHVSTDEVYGSLGPDDPAFHEETPYQPEQPLLGLQGRLRSPRARLLPHLRPARPHHQLLQQLRALTSFLRS